LQQALGAMPHPETCTSGQNNGTHAWSASIGNGGEGEQGHLD
jgi:hypothetical protein